MCFIRNVMFRSLGIMLALACGAGSLMGQRADGTLRGRVMDERGGLIVGAQVIVSGENSVTRDVVTNENGMYDFNNLMPGRYAVRASAPGFAQYEKADVGLDSTRTMVLDIRLTVAPTKEEVTVQSGSALNTDSDNNASAIALRGEDLDGLPDDPDALLAALKALAGPGAGPDGGQIFIDGFTSAHIPSKSSIREVRINQNPFSAEFDRLGFGRIEITTKAGAATYQGTAFFNFNDESFNSRNPFSLTRAPFQSRRYGGDLTGPFMSRKGSFFMSIERREIDDNAFINATVLDEAFNIAPLSQAVLVPQRRTSLSPRFDYQLDANNTLVGRYIYTKVRRSKTGVGDFSLLSHAYDTSSLQQTAQVTETAIIKRKIINEARLQFARETRRLDGGNSLPSLVVLDAFVGGGPQVGLSSFGDERWELSDNVMFVLGQHTIRSGGRLRRVKISDVSPQNFGGTLTFAGGLAPRLAGEQIVLDASGQPSLEFITSIERFRRTQVFQRQGRTPAEIRALGGGAAQFSIAGGNPHAHASQSDLGLFIQDDWRLRRNLTVNLGLRYERQTNIDSALDFAPRLAFAWAPGAGKNSKAKTIIRGGFGIFYSRVDENLVLQANRFNGATQRQFIITDPAVLDSFSGTPSIDELAGLAQPQTERRLADGLRSPYSIESALSIERQLPLNSTLTLTYLNLRTLHVLRTRNINAPLAGTFMPENPGSGVRPLGEMGNIYQYESSGTFKMNRLEVVFATRFNKKFSLNAVYGLGKAKSDTDGVNSFPANQYNLSTEYGRSALDIRHRLFLSGTMSAPFDIRLSPLIVAASGRPFNITIGRDLNGDTVFAERPAFATDLAKPGVVFTSFGAFDPNPAPGQMLVPRNYGNGPAFFAVSLRASKTFRFGTTGQSKTVSAPSASRQPAERRAQSANDRAGESKYALNFSIQAWNIFNHNNMNVPVGNLGSALFGHANSIAGSFGSGDPLSGNRVVEMQLRLSF
jgi:hypothetical protein